MNPNPFFHIDLATILNLVSTIAIVGALVFTAMQVRQSNRSQRDQAAVAMIKTVLGGNLARELKILAKLQPDARIEEIDPDGSEVESALSEFGVRLESVGYMVFRRMVTLDVVDELMGGAVLQFWERGRPWIERERTQSGNPRFLEWCQWLAERILERRTQRPFVPVHLRAGWRE